MTSVDVDEYLVKAAAERLASIGLNPAVAICGATGPLPGSYDRIVSMTSVAPVPASWLAAPDEAGPRLLWDLVDNIRHAWLTDGKLPAYGAAVTITPDGSVRLTRGRCQATIPAG